MDYCTGWFEGWWSACCQAHDAAYDAQVIRRIADAALDACVASSLPTWATGHPILTGAAGLLSTFVGALMYAGVRSFGGPFYRRAGRSSNSKGGPRA